ncbi:hypothetical protein Rhe02_62650 [Rhizocola hellebori]|uniref:Endonuclease/exonuclease/phosphatase domain-containing protein n=1 Tax=Rhizocola hellebori TaxID=1392758 RepID=A0A8J3QEK3_9ACTN|nr:hypothetical protein [Rhizocola hellebori]GIH08198.1 hypothetical protein Rhe02_62650 [Rhizocola hellebori]
MTETKMDFPEVDKLLGELSRARDAVGGGAKSFGEASETLGWSSYTTAIGGSVGSWSIPQPELVFGDTEGGGQCWSAHYECKIVMDTVLPAFANTLDSDIERLKTAVMLFHQTDGENADRMLQAARGGLDVLTAHLSTGANPEGEANRAGQLDKMFGQTGNDANATLVTGDFNNSPTGVDTPFGKSLNQYGQHGFDVHAGDLHDGQGGTSASHLPIDYVIPRGVGSTEATRWGRDESDHDGQVVDVTIPDW